MTQPFQDHADAGRQLAAALASLDPGDATVLALPRGGVPVAAEICARFGLMLDLVLVRKIGAPGRPELAVGAVAEGNPPGWEINNRIARAFGLGEVELQQLGSRQLEEIERRRTLYLGGTPRLPLSGRTLVVVDDGAATGATLRAALAAVRAAGPKRVIVALPVAPAELVDDLRDDGLEVVCLASPEPFYAVGQAYRSFPQITDAAVQAALARYGPGSSDAGGG